MGKKKTPSAAAAMTEPALAQPPPTTTSTIGVPAAEWSLTRNVTTPEHLPVPGIRRTTHRPHDDLWLLPLCREMHEAYLHLHVFHNAIMLCAHTMSLSEKLDKRDHKNPHLRAKLQSHDGRTEVFLKVYEGMVRTLSLPLQQEWREFEAGLRKRKTRKHTPPAPVDNDGQEMISTLFHWVHQLKVTRDPDLTADYDSLQEDCLGAILSIFPAHVVGAMGMPDTGKGPVQETQQVKTSNLSVAARTGKPVVLTPRATSPSAAAPPAKSTRKVSVPEDKLKSLVRALKTASPKVFSGLAKAVVTKTQPPGNRSAGILVPKTTEFKCLVDGSGIVWRDENGPVGNDCDFFFHSPDDELGATVYEVYLSENVVLARSNNTHAVKGLLRSDGVVVMEEIIRDAPSASPVFEHTLFAHPPGAAVSSPGDVLETFKWEERDLANIKSDIRFTLTSFADGREELSLSTATATETTTPPKALHEYVADFRKQDQVLYEAVRSRNWLRAMHLAQSEIGIMFRLVNGESCLHRAIINNAPFELLQTLIDAEDPGKAGRVIRDGLVWNSVVLAIFHGSDPRILCPLLCRSNMSQLEQDRLMFRCLDAHASCAVVDELLIHGADANTKHMDFTMLYHAIHFHASFETVQILVGSGADVNQKCYLDACPLIPALVWRYNDVRVARFLLEQGADPNVKCCSLFGPSNIHLDIDKDRKFTPLVLVLNAARTFFPAGKVCELTKILLEFGADPNIRDDYGFDAYDAALFSHHVDCIPMLREKMSFVDGDSVERFDLVSCSHCGKTSSSLSSCTKCHIAKYCNQSHAQADWTVRHKAECAEFRRRRPLFAMLPHLGDRHGAKYGEGGPGPEDPPSEFERNGLKDKFLRQYLPLDVEDVLNCTMDYVLPLSMDNGVPPMTLVSESTFAELKKCKGFIAGRPSNLS